MDSTGMRRIGELLSEGLNLAGIRLVLELEARNRTLQRQVERLREQA
ncbi:hypothetical protein [Microbacterium sp. A93]